MQAAATLESLPNEVLYDILVDADELDWRSSSPVKYQPQYDGVRCLKPAAGAMRRTSRRWWNHLEDWARCWFMELRISATRQEDLDLIASSLANSKNCELDLWITSSPFLEENMGEILLPYAPQIRQLYQNFPANPSPSTYHHYATLSHSRLFYLDISRVPTLEVPLMVAPQYPDMVIPHVRLHSVPPMEQLLKTNLYRAYHLDVNLRSRRSDEIVAFLQSESLKTTRKLRVILPWGFGRDEDVPDMWKSGRPVLSQLRTLRIEATLNGAESVLLALDTKHLSKLCLHIVGLFSGNAAMTPWNNLSCFENLSEVLLTISSHQTWFWRILTALPWSRLERLTFDMSGIQRLDDPPEFPPLVAERLTQLKCHARTVYNFLTAFQRFRLPVLDDLFIQVSFQGRLDLPTALHTAWESSCPLLSRIAVSTRHKFQLAELVSLLDILKPPVLRYLDLSRVECGDEDAMWKDAWSAAHASLINLEALSIAVPAKHTRLKYCFERCVSLRTLNLAFAHNSSFNVLRLLGKSGQGCLPKLQTLQLELPQDAKDFYRRNLLEMAPRLQEVVTYRKSCEISLREVGVLFPEDIVDLEVFSGLSLDVKLVWGDLCDTIFPYVSPIVIFDTWSSW